MVVTLHKLIKEAFISTIPVLTGYLVLGIGFGIIIKTNGYSTFLAFMMSLTIYAGSMQYVAISLLASSASLITVALTTLMVNARHLFYGISMLEKYKDIDYRKPYLIFTLTDETYSLLCNENKDRTIKDKNTYYFLVSFFDHMYWVAGSVIGAMMGSFITFSTEGIEFALTALFVSVFVEQWLSTKNHIPALIGLGATTVCLIIFGSENFLIPSMIIISLLLGLYKEEK